MLFTERLALLLETGVSLHAGLKSLREQTDDPRLETNHRARCATRSCEGSPLSAALRQHPQMFPATYVNLVAAAEDGGFLPQVLQQLIDMDEKAERLRSTLFAALSYPAFLVFFSFATIVFVLVGVFPKFTEMFERIRADLPMSTLVLMAVSDTLRQHWPWILGGCGVLLAGAVSWLQQPAARGAIDGLKLRIPLVSDLFVQIYLTQTLRVMGLSLANGVPVVDALRACQDLVRNSVFARFIDTLRLQVTEGRGIAHGFEQTAFIPPLVRQMIAHRRGHRQPGQGDDARCRLLRPRADQAHHRAVEAGRAGDAADHGRGGRHHRVVADPADLQAEPCGALGKHTDDIADGLQ